MCKYEPLKNTIYHAPYTCVCKCCIEMEFSNIHPKSEVIKRVQNWLFIINNYGKITRIQNIFIYMHPPLNRRGLVWFGLNIHNECFSVKSTILLAQFTQR